MANGSGWGGSREGAGRKPEGYEPPPEKVALDEIRAQHEAVKKAEREFKLAREQGLYVSREAVRQASATALALLSQAVRSIPDNCERQFGISPEVAAAMQEQCDAALTELAAAFRAMAGDQ